MSRSPFIALAVAVFLSLAALSCSRTPTRPTGATAAASGAEGDAAGSSNVNIALSTVDPEAISASFPGETTPTSNRTAFEARAAKQLATVGAIQGDLSIFEGPLPSAKDLTRAHALEVKGTLPFTNVFYRMSAETGNVGGCIGKSNVPHLGFMLKDKITDRQIVNVHLASWPENARRCFGVYNSPNGWCKKICGPSRSQMQGLLRDALVAAGVSTTIASIISSLITPVVAGALAL